MSKEEFGYTAEKIALYEIWGALQVADDIYSFLRAKRLAKNVIRRLEGLELEENQTNE